MSDRFRGIGQALDAVRTRIMRACDASERDYSEIKLIVVTKTFPASDVEILRNFGIEDFGENRDAEGKIKSEMVGGIWHFQGQIQSNKIKSIARWASFVHSLDESKHIQLLNDAVPEGRKMGVFIQVCLDPQPGRGGVAPVGIRQLAELVQLSPNLRLEGLMAVAPLSMDAGEAFTVLGQIHSDFKGEFPSSPYLSAGMSDDFELAIAHGATHIRVGSSILGSR